MSAGLEAASREKEGARHSCSSQKIKIVCCPWWKIGLLIIKIHQVLTTVFDFQERLKSSEADGKRKGDRHNTKKRHQLHKHPEEQNSSQFDLFNRLLGDATGPNRPEQKLSLSWTLILHWDPSDSWIFLSAFLFYSLSYVSTFNTGELTASNLALFFLFLWFHF